MFDLVEQSEKPLAIEPSHLSLAFSPGVGSAEATRTIPTQPQIQVQRQSVLESVVSEMGGPGTGIPSDLRKWTLDHFCVGRDSNGLTSEQRASDALLLIAAGEVERAVALLPPQDNRDFWTSYALSRALFSLGRFSEAEAVLRDASTALPQDPRPFHALGKMLLERGLFQAAASVLAEASDRPHASYEVWIDHAAALIALDNSNEAIRLLRRALRKNSICATALNNMGVSYAKRGDRQRAIKYFGEALAVKPNFVPARNNLGELLINAQEYDRALDVLECSSDLGSVQLRAWCHMQLGKTERARRLLTSAVENSADSDPVLWNNLGVVQMASRLENEAESSFRKAVAFSPDNVALVSNLGRLLTGSGKSEEAVTLFWKWKERIQETSAGFADLFSTALVSANRIVDAINVLQQAIGRFADNETLWANLGYLHASRRDQPDLAVEVLREGLARLPNSLRIRNNLAYALLKIGRTEEAGGVLEPTRSAIHSPFRDAVHVCLLATWGLFLIRLGRYIEGRKHYDDALKVAPTEALRQRVKQKMLVEDAIFEIGRGNQAKAEKLLRRALGLGADVEFTAEAKALLSTSYRQ